MHRNRMLLLIMLSITLLATILTSSVWAAPAPDWLTASEISSAMSLPDGSHVSLRLEEIVKIKNSPAYIVIAESFSRKDRLICLTNPSSELRLGQSVDVEGDLVTLRQGVRALQNVTIWGYLSESGELLLHPPIIKCLSETTPWQWKIDLTIRDSMSSMASRESFSSDEPNSDPAEGPSYYPKIGNTAETSEIGSSQTQAQSVRTQSFYNGIPDLVGLPAGSLVELQCKRVIGVGTETINGTTYKYFDMADDLPSTDWIRCYYNAGSPTTDSRINKIAGQTQYTNNGTTEVICVDDGPDYNPQIMEGSLSLVSPNTVAFVRTQADGASASLTGKVVTANQMDFPGALYVQEPLSSGYFGGIRVLYSGSTITRGSLVDITGTVALAADGEREVSAGSTGVTFVEQSTVPGPLGMPNKHFGGGSFNVYTPGINSPAGSGTGLFNKGLLVKIWGKVTAVDANAMCFWIDDGTAYRDTTGNTGIKISWAWPTSGKALLQPPLVGWYVSVVGISGSETPDGGTTLIRVLHVRNQSDITIHAEDTPPVVTLTTPSGSDWHKASNIPNIILGGNATDQGLGISSVLVAFNATGSIDPPTTWNNAAYDSDSHKWSYDWQTPASQRVWIRAIDGAGNTATIYRDVTVTTASVVYVNGAVTASGNGLSWQTAKKTVTEGMSAASSGMDVWVATRTYAETTSISLASGVGLYGGFYGNETVREQRNWSQNVTVLDGSSIPTSLTNRSVVTAATGVDQTAHVDGFTVRNGRGTSNYGGGINCSGGSPCIENNLITGGSSNYGAGIACTGSSSALIRGNTISDNSADSTYGYAGGIYCSSSSPTITANMITGNQKYGIYCSSAPAMVTGNIISGNASGGMSISSSSVTVSSNKIVANGTSGCECSWSAPTITNNLVTGSTYGLYFHGGPDTAVTVTNNTIIENGTGIQNAWSSLGGAASNINLCNNIIALNSVGMDNTGARTTGLLRKNNDFFNPSGSNYNGTMDVPQAVDGNVFDDPRFAGLAFGGLHIQQGSPCIDAGWDSAPGMPTVDIDGQPRRQDGNGDSVVVVDIGADESDGSRWSEDPASIIHVSPSGNDSNDGSTWGLAKRTVQSGIDAAAALSGEVWVAADTYHEIIRLRPFVSVYGGFSGTERAKTQRDWSAHETILDGANLGRSVVTAMGVMHASIDGFTIRNGGSGSRGIYCRYGSLSVSHNHIMSNAGGGIYCGYCKPIVSHNTIESNSASDVGVGVYIDNCAVATIANNFIRNNTKTGAGQWPGGGVYCYMSPATIVNNVIYGNSAYDCGGIYSASSGGKIFNNTITHNIGGSYGSGLYMTYSSARVTNNIIAWNGSSNISGVYVSNSPSAVFECNDVFGQTRNYYGITDQTGKSGNISIDPLLDVLNTHISVDPSGNDCKDKGLSSVVADGDLDIDDEPRCADGAVDIGADEIAGCVRYVLTVTAAKHWSPLGESVRITINVYDPSTRAFVPDYRVDFSVNAGRIVSVLPEGHIDQPPASGYGITDSNGNVFVDITSDNSELVDLTAVVSNCDVPVARSTRVGFGENHPAVEIVFLIDVTGSTDGGNEIKNGVTATVDYLSAQLQTMGEQLQVAGIKFSDAYPANPLVGNNQAVIYNFTTDVAAFKTWVNTNGPGGGTEYQFDILMFAKDMDPYATPGLYLALATDEDSDSSLDKAAVVNALRTSNSIVFIDPAESDLVTYYTPLAVNGGAVESQSGNLGTFTFQHMRQAILGSP